MFFYNLVVISMYLQISRICKFRGTLSAAKRFFTLVLIFMYLQIFKFPDLEFHEEQLNGFSFWSRFSCIFRSSDSWIYSCVLREAECFFLLVLIFMYLQISRIRKLNAAKRCFILVLIFMYLQISRISQFRGRLSAAE